MKIKSEDYIEEVDDIRKYKPIHNKVVVKQVTDNTVKHIAGVEIVFPTHVRIGKVAARNAIRYGEVISVPDNFVSRSTGRYQTRWDSRIEVQPGDIVWCESTGFHNAERLTDEQENIYYIVDYQNLVVAKRGADVIMLNGRVLLEVIERSDESSLRLTKEPSSICRVVHTGSDNSGYRFPGFEDPEIQVGDLVYVHPTKYFKLEDDLWKAFGGDYRYTQKPNILGKVEAGAEEAKEEGKADGS